LANHSPAAAEEAEARRGHVMSGQYLSLYNYLQNRYANTVVLTFAEIEDLLGFSLPDPARLRPEWWTSGAPNTVARPRYSDSWVLAHRSAQPNLSAQTVLFARTSGF
jgi:hypothetical protein